MHIRTIISLSLLGAGVFAPSSAALRLHQLFADNMVIQREIPVHVWGKGDSGKEVSVSFGGKSATTTVKSDGRWSVTLPAMATNTTAQILEVVSNGTTKKINNVLIGDVWVLGGQSNMELGLKNADGYQGDLSALYSDKVRFMQLFIAKFPKSNYTPNATSVAMADDSIPVKHSWKTYTSANLADIERFSAVGGYLADKIQDSTGVPVGLIGTAMGGTDIEPWIPKHYLQAADTGKLILNRFYAASNQEAQDEPGVLYNFFVQGLRHFPIKGYAFYQGEANSEEYGAKYHHWAAGALVRALRQEFDFSAQNFPLLIVQVHPWLVNNKYELGYSYRAEIRENQFDAFRTEPNTGLVSLIDLSDGDIHPNSTRRAIGLRTGTYALGRFYARLTKGYSSPFITSLARKGSKVVLQFSPDAEGLKTTDGQSPKSFLVRSASSKTFERAEAAIVGNTVEVWSNTISQIHEVRYAWECEPTINLYNKYNLPIGQFKALVDGDVPPVGTTRPTLAQPGSLQSVSTHHFTLQGRAVAPGAHQPTPQLLLRPGTTGVQRMLPLSN